MSRHEVKMPVIAINDHCIECPDLDIGVAQKEISFGTDPFERVVENTIYCKHYERCKFIYSNLTKSDKKDESQQKQSL